MKRLRRITLSRSIAALLLLLPLTLSAASNDPSISYQYDAMGNLTQRSDGLGHVTTQRFDALNRLISQLQPALNGADTPGEIQYQYDAQGNTAQITDPKGFTTDNTIDGLGNLKQLDSPDTGTSTYSHDQAGNLVSKIDAAGVAASYSYDVVNRLTQVQHAKSGATTESVTLQYDQGPNGLGRLSNMRNNSGLINTWNYDRQGRITGQLQTTGQLNLKLQIQYDNAGRPQTLIYPSGRVVAYHYDATGRISQIDVDGVAAITGIIWQPFGGVQSWTWAGSGNSYARSYDLAGRVTSVTLGDNIRSLEWDAGNRITQSLDNAIIPAATAANLQTYDYDNLDHLTQYLNPNTRQDYSYDLAGNRTRRSTDGNVVDYDYAPNNNQLVATPTKSFSYDAVGRVINDGVNQYSYNHSGQLSQVVNSLGRTWYYYNGLGQRVGKWVSNPQDLAGDADHDGKITVLDLRKIVIMTQGAAPIDLAADCNRDNAISLADVDCGVSKRGSIDQYPLTFTHFVYDPTGHLIGEYRQIGTPKQETVYLGDTPVLILMPGTTTPAIYTIDTDHLNTPRVIKTNAGAIVWRWDQAEPFGSTQPNSNPSGLGAFTYNLRFPGQYYDAETGLHYNMARYYHPDLGRYLQSDPIGLAGGINTYTYVSNNPVNLIDPDGLEETGLNQICASNGQGTNCSTGMRPPPEGTPINGPLSPVGIAATAAEAGLAACPIGRGIGLSKSSDRLLWGSWKDYQKITANGREYAQLGDRLYTRHAVDRMQPGGLGTPAGGDGPGRSFSPNLINEVISNGLSRSVTVNGVERTIYSSGTAEVVTEQGGRIVITVNPFRGGQ